MDRGEWIRIHGHSSPERVEREPDPGNARDVERVRLGPGRGRRAPAHRGLHGLEQFDVPVTGLGFGCR